MKKAIKIKKAIALLMVVAVILCTSAAALADMGENKENTAPISEANETEVVTEDTLGAAAMDMIIEYGVQLVFTLLMTLIGALGAWLAAVAGKNKKMQNVANAIDELVDATKTTVGSLQQTVVDGLKAASKDNKLTEDEIKMLGVQLKEKTLQKLSEPALKVLEAAGIDAEAWIEDAAEDWINTIKRESGTYIASAIAATE